MRYLTVLVSYHFLRFCAATTLLAAFSVPAYTLTAADSAVKEAAEGFRLSDLQRVKAAQPQARGHMLEAYVDYWALRLQIDNLSDAQVGNFLKRHEATSLADRLRTDWLRELGRRGDWEGFSRFNEGFMIDDSEIACYRATLATRNEKTMEPVVPAGIWADRLTDACAEAFAAISARKWVTADDALWRFRSSADGGSARAGERSNWALSVAMPGVAPSAEQLQRAHSNPELFLRSISNTINTNTEQARPQHEAALYALTKLARSDVVKARTLWPSIMNRFSDEKKRYAAGQLAYASGRRLDSADALMWFRQTADGNGKLTRMGDWQLAWITRAALRTATWPEVLRAIEAMTPAGQTDPAWRFWKARALDERADSADAKAIYAELAKELHFYGLLAAETAGIALPPLAQLKAGAIDLEAADFARYDQMPAAKRAVRLSELGLRADASREWSGVVRNLSDNNALIASEWMRRQKIWDRSINTAELTRERHDFSLRYQTPYADELKKAAKQNGLDVSLVLGLVRQESRFWAEAVSAVGAMGLMQMMPATGKWLAGRMKVADFRPSQLNDVGVNTVFGTYYLRMVLDQMGGSEPMAAASYNAGPGRARGWQGNVALEGAIYAESIPFNETRDYVKKVLTNAVWYSYLSGEGSTSIRRRLGIIAAKP